MKSISVADPINHIPDEPLTPLTLEHFFMFLVFLAGALDIALLRILRDCFIYRASHIKLDYQQSLTERPISN